MISYYSSRLFALYARDVRDVRESECQRWIGKNECEKRHGYIVKEQTGVYYQYIVTTIRERCQIDFTARLYYPASLSRKESRD